jgi:signal transduction histidine kinase
MVAGELREYELEKRYFRKDGTMVRALLSVSLVQAQEGGERYAVGMLEDITERKAAEAALEDSRRQFLQAQKMEAVGRLAGGVAHDFNNMLTAIRGNAELLLMDTPEGHPQREDLMEIRRAADRSADLTRQLLAFSRQQVLQPRVLNLNQSVTTMERMLRRLIGEDVELSTALEPGLGQVTADPGQVEQVVMNMAVNARDAMPRGGKLWVKTDNVYLAEGDPRLGVDGVPGRYVALCVADTGCGMDADTLARIWEPFFTTKEQGKGTGLGLATVYGIVKQSGGTAWAESEPGKGAAVTVYLPRTDAASDADEVHGEAGPMPRGTETILVVEDEIAVRMLTNRVLTRSGFRVIAASDPAEAIELFSAHAGRVDLVVTDLVMPGMDGMRLSEILRERDPSLPVLLTTGYSAEALDPERVRPDQDILLKPFDPGTLVRKVREILDRP